MTKSVKFKTNNKQELIQDYFCISYHLISYTYIYI